MTNLPSPTSGSLSNLDSLDPRTLFREYFNAKQEINRLLRQLNEGQCPISSLPADQCARCVTKDPRHYPKGLTGKIQTILQKFNL